MVAGQRPRQVPNNEGRKVVVIAPSESMFKDLTGAEFAQIKTRATARHFAKDELIFAEGDVVDYIYFIDTGRVSIFIRKFTAEDEINRLGPGDYFGEMAVFYKDRRTASARALTDVTLLTVDKGAFLDLLRNERALADKINTILARRNEELLLKESLIDSTGMQGRSFHVSIKGDPSLRESAFTRERYQNIVDEVLPELQPRLEDLLINRSVYEVVVHLNSGEIHTASVFNPFCEEIHPANKIADETYVERHFPLVAYDDKVDLIRRVYGLIAADRRFADLPEHHRKICATFYDNWQPLPPDDVRTALSRLSMLRNIPDFYLRNFTISMTRDAIRLQFNCDGTHIVGAEDYERFVKDNVPV
jgi:CRP-like cAMP-binding protein